MKKYRPRGNAPADLGLMTSSPRARVAAMDCCLTCLRMRNNGRPDDDFFKFIFDIAPEGGVAQFVEELRAGGFQHVVEDEDDRTRELGQRLWQISRQLPESRTAVWKAAEKVIAGMDAARNPIKQVFNPDQLAERLGRGMLRQNPELRTLLSGWLKRQRDLVSGLKEPRQGVVQRLEKLGRMFRLSPCAVDLFFVLYLLTRHQLGPAISFRNRFSEMLDRFGFLAAIGRWPEAELRKEMQPDAPLRRYGLMDHDLDLSLHAVTYLEGLSNVPLYSRFYTEVTAKPLPLEAHADFAADIAYMKNQLTGRRPGESLNILFHGTPGTGKTELARSLGHALGLTTYEIRGMDRSSPGKEDQFRLSAIHACIYTVDVERSLIIVDEADDLLNCGGDPFAMFFGGGAGGGRNGGDKGSLNQIMNSSKAAIIWITNASRGIEEPTRRRFDYSMEFTRFTKGQRRRVWQNALEKHHLGCLTAAEVEQLAGEYPLNAGGIAMAARNAVRALRAGGVRTLRKASRQQLMDAMRPTIQAHMRITGAAIAEEAARPATAHYSLEGLTIKSDQPLAENVEILRAFSRHIAGTRAECAAGDVAGEVRNMNVLLYGPPGTGKTEFAKYLARELERPLHVRLASDLLDKYVGESEKLIRAAFRDAEREKAVLLLDEADSLLHTRGKAQRSWEITQVNEILSNMETFRGILVCTTNFKDNLDPASLRRFNLKIAFDYLTREGVELFYKRMLAPLVATPLVEENGNLLAGLGRLTPGDFKVVRQKYGFMPRESITHARLLAALACECEARRNETDRAPMGFQAA